MQINILRNSNWFIRFLAFGNIATCLFFSYYWLLLSYLSESLYSSYIYRHNGIRSLNKLIDSKVYLILLSVFLISVNIYALFRKNNNRFIIYLSFLQIWIYFIGMLFLHVVILVSIISIHK